MATTSYLYHAFGLTRYHHLKTEFRGGAIYLHVMKKKDERTCAGCGANWTHLTMEGRFQRTFHALPVGRRPQFIVLHGHEQRCGRCGRRLREPIDFAHGKRRCIKAFERLVIDLCRIATIKHVALFPAVGWDLVKDIFKGHLKKRLRKRKWKKIRYIAVDEFAVRKRHQYMTVVLDLETGEIIHAQPGKDAAALTGFLMKLKRRKAKPPAVAMDMSPAYMQAVRQVFPDVDIVHDPYHVVALVNEAIDETRRDLSRQLSGQGKSHLKGSRFLLLMGLEKLSDSDWVRLQGLMDINRPLFRAYLLKEVLREFWRLGSKTKGRAFLLGWIDQALALENPHFAKLADTLTRHMEGMLSYFRHPITTGPLEGLNNKIKVLKRQAYGFRDMEYFKLRLFFIHEDTPAFPG